MKKIKMIYFLLLILFLIWIAYGYFAVKWIESLGYTIIEKKQNYEVRLVPKHIVAETKVSWEFSKATNSGFGIIANYIFWDNTKGDEISMTTPVINKKGNEKISMTSPVIQSETDSTLSFVMPKKYTLDTLPKPNDKRVVLKEVKEKTYGVIQFSWFYSDKKFEKKKEELLEALKKDSISYESIFFVSYNPPFTPPFMNKMEVWAELKVNN